MDEHEILEKIRDIIADKLDAEAGELTNESRLQEDLGADSLDVAELIMGLQD